MKALISPEENVYKYDGTLLGARVAQIDETGFDVAEPLFWVDCGSGVVTDCWYYDADTSSIIEIPAVPIIVTPVETPVETPPEEPQSNTAPV